MMNNNRSISRRQGIWAACLLAFAFMLARPDEAQAQWVTNGNNINNTNGGNVGIGTTTPNTKLHVLMAPTTNVITKQTDLNGFLLLSGWGDLTAKTGFVGSFATSPGISSGVILGREGPLWGTYVAFHTHGDHANALDELAERMRISSNGKVGIGVTSPNTRFSITPTVTEPKITLWDGGGTASHFGFGISDNQLNYHVLNNGSSHVFYQGGKNGDGVPLMIIKGSGAVGIGVTSPNTRLSITPTVTEPKITLWDGGGTASHFGFGISDNQLNYHVISGSSHVFYQGGKNGDGVPLMIIKGTGNVGVATTTPGYRLDVQGGQINSSGGLCIAGDCKTSWSQLAISQWTTSSTNIFYNSGNVGVGTTAPSSRLHVVGDVTLTGTGNISASGTITAGNIVARYQDIAEWVPARRAMPAGTVVVLDIEMSNHVVASQTAYDTRVAGVVSDSPGVILGEGGYGKVKVATTGRVRVKVDATRAPIRVGDLLVTSDKEGIAMRSEPLTFGGTPIHRPGTLIGKALEPLAKGAGEILVLLSLQ